MSLDRNKYIGSSNAADILDESKWFTMYQEKMGLVEREDLSEVFPVQYGAYTESFHLDWLAKMKSDQWIWSTLATDGEQHYGGYHNEKVPYGSHPDARINLDNQATMCVEVKTSSRFKTTEEAAHFWMGQLQHHMMCWGESEIYFSVIIGTAEPEPIYVGASEEWQEHYLEMGERFWSHVTNKQAPKEHRSATITPIGISNTVPINGKLNRNVSDNNHAVHLISCINKMRPHIAADKEARAEMKKLITNDDASIFIPDVFTYKRTVKGTPVLRITDEEFGT
jgi:hypothetical protein